MLAQQPQRFQVAGLIIRHDSGFSSQVRAPPGRRGAEHFDSAAGDALKGRRLNLLEVARRFVVDGGNGHYARLLAQDFGQARPYPSPSA